MVEEGVKAGPLFEAREEKKFEKNVANACIFCLWLSELHTLVGATTCTVCNLSLNSQHPN